MSNTQNTKDCFDLPIKVYVENDEVHCSLKVSDFCTRVLTFTVSEFTEVLKECSGLETSAGRIWWELRPDFLAIHCSGWNWRFPYDTHWNVIKQFEKQKNG